MGMSGISGGSLLLILLIVVLIFGTKKLRNMGSDLGEGVRNFRDSVKDGEAEVKAERAELSDESESDADFSNSSQTEKQAEKQS